MKSNLGKKLSQFEIDKLLSSLLAESKVLGLFEENVRIIKKQENLIKK